MQKNIITYSKIKFYPLEPKESDIRIEDIAHSLSLMTRANGHFRQFYSVAQHSINCMKEAWARGNSTRVQLACLLHDASESYISDITRPVKCCLPEYCAIEDKLQNTIFRKFSLRDLSEEEKRYIEEVDDLLLHLEFEVLMGEHLSDRVPDKTIEHDLSQRDFVSVEREFLSCFRRLTGEHNDTKCVGIDGCKGGWVAVSISDHNFEINVYKNIEEICVKYDHAEPILIDMPIGLPQSTEDIRPDNAARSMLKGKTSSIFNTPCRQAVYAGTYNEANDINRKVMGKGLSAQSYAICGKIREIDDFLNNHMWYRNKLLESHPELCFAVLNEGSPILENKKTQEGIKRRVKLLSRYYDRTEEVIQTADTHPKLRSMLDNVIDALCLAISGRLIQEKGIMTIPEKPMMDESGILMQMVYQRV